MIVFNLYGGPGTGKSTTASELFSLLKWEGYNCELVTEYAKDLVWEESYKKLENPLLVFATQYSRLHRLKGKVDISITDSPLLLCLAYLHNTTLPLDPLITKCHEEFDNINIYLKREKQYVPVGRLQTEEEAKEKDLEIISILKEKQESYRTFNAVKGVSTSIYMSFLDKLGKDNV